MAQHEPVDPLLEFDALLTQELSVTPSPEFLPRVRERIRTEPAVSRWGWLWIMAPLAAAVLVVVAVGLSLVSEPPVPSPQPPAPVSAQASADKPAPESPAPSPRSRALSPAPANRESRTATSEVLIDPRQREALLSLMRLVDQGGLTEESFKRTTEPPAVIEAQVKEIAVDPLVVSPIAPGGVLPSELERK